MTSNTAAEPTIVRRDIALDVDRDEAWELVAGSEGWVSWLVDDADLDVAPGAEGTVDDDGERRHVSVTRVDDGHSVEFVWWSDGGPERASSVTLTVIDGEDGRAVVRVVESFPPRLAAFAPQAALRWEVRAAAAWTVCLAGTRV